MAQSLKHKAVDGVLWKIGEQGIKQGFYFISSVIIARLVMPDQFGMVAMLSVFTAVAGVFIDAGFSTALVRKKDRTHADCCTVYWFNVIISILCYIILFFCAPLVARFYEMPQLTAILRVTAIGIVIGSLSGVHGALLNAELRFKEMTKFNLIGMILSITVGITMAYMDFQVWALVAQGLTSTTVGAICVWYKVKWRPSLIISRQSLNEFFGFGSKLLASGLLDTLYSNIYTIVIGKVYRAADLAFYNRAKSLTSLSAELPTGILQSVTYPTLCKLQDDEAALKNGFLRTIRLASFVIFPICVGLGAVAYPLINVLYTDQWLFAAPLLSIIVFNAMWYPVHAINLNYLIVKGKTNLFLRVEIIKKIQGLCILCITIPLGIKAMCWGSVVGCYLCLIWNTYYNGKYLKMSIIAQLKELWHILALCAVMYAASRSVATYLGNDIVSLISSIAVGVIIYAGGALLFRFPEVKELLQLKK